MSGALALGAIHPFAALAQQSDAAKRLDEKLQSFDPCKDDLAGLDVPGFKLKCKTMMTGGTTLGSVPVIYMTGTVNECASKCRPVGKCVAFSFNTALDNGKHRCEIFGATPQGIDAKTWIAGTR